MDPALFREFCQEFTREMNRLRLDGRASMDTANAQLGRIDKQIRSKVDAIADGMYHPSMKAKMNALEERKACLEAELAQAHEPPPLLHPRMAHFYREQVAGLATALSGDQAGQRTEASERLRSHVSKIVLVPEAGKLAIEVQGDLAGILTIAGTNALRRG
jgi:site-specific DNA recombinase